MKARDYERVRSALFASPSPRGAPSPSSPENGGSLVRQPDFKALLRAFPWASYDTLVSIYSQDCVARVKQAYVVHRRPDKVAEYCERWVGGETLAGMSEALDFPPCSLVRILLPSLLGPGVQGKLTKIFNDPDHLLSLCRDEGDGGLPPEVSASSVDLTRLVADVRACIERDHVTSPLVASLKRSVGLEYESLLSTLLSSAGIAYESESDLRKKGATKTPDALLKIPILVGNHVVHWIDSKACFCSEDLYYNDGIRQFRQYVNRFGSGLVIYWFGFIEDLPFEESILVLDAFPTQVTRLRLCGAAREAEAA